MSWISRIIALFTGKGSSTIQKPLGRPGGSGPSAAGQSSSAARSEAPKQARTLEDPDGPPAPMPSAGCVKANRGHLREHEAGGHHPDFSDPVQKVIDRIGLRLKAGKFVLPHIPSTSQSAIDMASKPSVDFDELVALIEPDPVLSTELLRTANSAVYGGAEPVETLHCAAVRIGLRSLRSLILAISLRGVILRDKTLAKFAEDVWRQAYSVGTIARAIAEPMGMDPDRAYLLGLLQDIGKVSLLAMIRRENKEKVKITPALIGRVFNLYHEQAGAALAAKWKLSEELVAVAGCHHDYENNPTHGRSAAFARLAHRMDLALSLSEDDSYRSLVDYPEFEFLNVSSDRRHHILHLAQKALDDQATNDKADEDAEAESQAEAA